MCQASREKSDIDLNAFIKSVQQALDSEGIFLSAIYNWYFCERKGFDY